MTLYRVGGGGGCGRSYADLVARVEACLLDAFGTVAPGGPAR